VTEVSRSLYRVDRQQKSIIRALQNVLKAVIKDKIIEVKRRTKVNLKNDNEAFYYFFYDYCENMGAVMTDEEFIKTYAVVLYQVFKSKCHIHVAGFLDNESKHTILSRFSLFYLSLFIFRDYRRGTKHLQEDHYG
jgi:hypothetical protein